MWQWPSRTTVLAVLGLAGAWSGLALGLGTMLAMPLDETRRVPTTSIQRRLLSSTITVAGRDPCTQEALEVEALLAFVILPEHEMGGMRADVEVELRSPSGATGSVYGIEPLQRGFSFWIDSIGNTMNVGSLRTPLVGRHSLLDLVVDLVGGVDAQGEVRLSAAGARIDTQRERCNASLPDGPGHPLGQLVERLLAN